ncbi:hypothetical protein Tco_1048998, partial [Tanacetum coccineum]
IVYHDLYLGGKALIERENMGFDLTKSDLFPSFVKDLTVKGVGLRVADSHTGNHREDGFTPLETIRMFLEMDLRSFMMEGVDGEFNFIPEDGLDKEGNSPSTRSVNNEAPTIDAEPLTTVHPSEFAENLDVDSDPDIHEFPSAKELKDSSNFHWVVAPVTPPSWKQHLKEISLEKLYDIHDRAYMRQVILNNMLNIKTHKLMSILSKARASCDAIREREVKKDKAYAKLERKFNEALQDLEKNSLSWICVPRLRLYKDRLTNSTVSLESERERLKSSEVHLLQEINSLRQDRVVVVSKVVPHVAMEIVRSDEMGLLVTRLVKVAMFRGWCTAFEEVADLKEPFILEKMPGYRPSFGKEFNQAGDDLAIASYPFIAEATVDPYATVEQLLSKKPRSLQTKLAPSYSKTSSSKAPIN